MARTEAGVDDSVFVTVGSTDPGELMEQLEEQAVSQLNTRDVILAWHQWEIDGAREWLHRLESKSLPLSYGDEYHIGMLRSDITRREKILRGAG